jgi:hypothetical protein
MPFTKIRGKRLPLAWPVWLMPLGLALVFGLLSAPSSFAQAPALDPRPSDYASNLFSLDAIQNTTAPGGQSSGYSGNSNGDDKNRLSINPVTGLAVSSADNYTPLTGHERWKIYWKQNYLSVGAYFGPVFTAAVLDQTTDSPTEWKGHIGGFGLRVANRTASAMVQGTVQAPLAALLHEDVRYIQSGPASPGRRVLHAIMYSFLTYNTKGHPTPNIANLSAYYASTAISTTWLPDGRSTSVGYIFTNGSEQIAISLPVNILQEFWPEITREVLRRHPPANPSPISN